MNGLDIEGTRYYSASDLAKRTGISRQTLWRWRQEGKIPLGHRFRDGKLFFTATELHEVFEYVNRIEPVQYNKRLQGDKSPRGQV